jgi:23S rRNA-/tRNA-specific pseudouridylate synthase
LQGGSGIKPSDTLTAQLPYIQELLPPSPAGASRLLPAHRLDRDVSGLLLLARHTAAADSLSRAFAAGSIKKLCVILFSRRTKVT